MDKGLSAPTVEQQTNHANSAPSAEQNYRIESAYITTDFSDYGISHTGQSSSHASEKAISICPSCGAENPVGSKFCGECGYHMPNGPSTGVTTQSQLGLCAKCGAELLPDAKVCKQCGVTVQRQSTSPVAAQQPIYRAESVLEAFLARVKGNKNDLALIFTDQRVVELRLDPKEIEKGGRYDFFVVNDGMTGDISRLMHLRSQPVEQSLLEYPQHRSLDYASITQVLIKKWSAWSGTRFTIAQAGNTRVDYDHIQTPAGGKPSDTLDELMSSLMAVLRNKVQYVS